MRVAFTFVALLCPLLIAAVKPATKPTTTQADGTINGVAPLIDSLPADAAPVAGKWDEFREPKALKWFRDNFDQKTIQLSAPIQSVAVSRIFSSTDSLVTLGWELHIEVEDAKPGPKESYGFRAKPTMMQSFDFRVGEPEAKAAKAWKQGDLFTVKGTIVGIALLEPMIVDVKSARSVPAIRVTLDKYAFVGVTKNPAPKR